MLTTLSNWTSLYINCANLFKMSLIWPYCVFSQTFYPNLKIFLHEYIRHIRDISQLWEAVNDLEISLMVMDFKSSNVKQLNRPLQQKILLKK